MANPQPTTGTGSGIGNKKKKKTSKESDNDDAEEPTSPPQTHKQKADKKKKTVKESDSVSEEETATTGNGSGIGNKKKKKKTSKESDSDDEDEPTSSPQTRKQKADKKKKTDERTWTDWGFGGLNIRGLIVNRVDKKAEVEKLIDEHKLDILVIGESHLRDVSGKKFKIYHQLCDWLGRFEQMERDEWRDTRYIFRIEDEQYRWNMWNRFLRNLKQHERFYDLLRQLHDWLQPQHEQLEINNFSCLRFDRTYTSSDKSNTKGGGLLIYIRKEIQFCVTSVFEWTDPKLKVQYVKLFITRPFEFELVAIYSPPKSEARFFVQRLMTALLKLNQERNIPVMFIGDMNIDRNRHNCARGIFVPRGRNPCVGRLFALFRENYRAATLINSPTSKNGYCIDHIITNIHEVPEGTDVRITEADVVQMRKKISDHKLIYCRADEQPGSSAQLHKYHRFRESSVQMYKYTSLAVSEGKWIKVVLNDKGKVYVFPCAMYHTKETIELMEELNRPEDGKKIACLAANCNEKFDTYDAMGQHEHDKHFPCFDCDKVLKDKYYGPEHMQRVHGIYMCRSVHCNDLRFSDSQERDKHENDGNHLVCKECKDPMKRRAFSSKVAYKRHKKSHRQHGAVATK